VALFHLVLARNHLGTFLMNPPARNLPDAERELLAARKTIRDVASANANPNYRCMMGQVETNLGKLYYVRDDKAEARAAFDRAVPILEQVAADEPSNIDYMAHLAVSYRDLGQWHGRHGSFADALGVLRKGRGIWERLAAGQPRISGYWHELGLLDAAIADLQATTDRGTAVATYRDAVRHLLKAGNPNPTNWVYVHRIGQVALRSALIADGRDHPLADIPVESVIGLVRPFTEQLDTRDAARKLVDELDRARQQPPPGSPD
jgi:tetratricopeptide (TPR) repeat protein